jgi:hypothetical protein
MNSPSPRAQGSEGASEGWAHYVMLGTYFDIKKNKKLLIWAMMSIFIRASDYY